MTVSAPDRWVAVLDELEQRIDAQEAVLELAAHGRQPELGELLERITFVPPTDLPDMPPEFAERANQLLTRLQIAQERLAELIETTRPLRAPRARTARRSSMTTLDIRA